MIAQALQEHGRDDVMLIGRDVTERAGLDLFQAESERAHKLLTYDLDLGENDIMPLRSMRTASTKVALTQSTRGFVRLHGALSNRQITTRDAK